MPYIYLVVLLGLASIILPSIVWGPGEIGIRANGALTLVFAAMGETLAISTGGIDLSVGGMISVVNTLLASHLTATGWLFGLELVAVIAGCSLVGAFNGFVVAKKGLQPFIVTLATLSILNGVAIWILPVEGGATSSSLLTWTSGSPLGVPLALIIVAVIIVAWWWFRSSRLVMDLRAIGSDRRRAALSGVAVSRRTIQCYALSGCFAACAGIWLSSQIASGDPTIGADYILPAVAAVVIGGASIYGGSGSIVASTVGCFALLAIPSLVFALALESFTTVLLQGALLLVAVGITSQLNQLGKAAS
jgi:ribose transport system permease protein